MIGERCGGGARCVVGGGLENRVRVSRRKQEKKGTWPLTHKNGRTVGGGVAHDTVDKLAKVLAGLGLIEAARCHDGVEELTARYLVPKHHHQHHKQRI